MSFLSSVGAFAVSMTAEPAVGKAYSLVKGEFPEGPHTLRRRVSDLMQNPYCALAFGSVAAIAGVAGSVFAAPMMMAYLSSGTGVVGGLLSLGGVYGAMNGVFSESSSAFTGEALWIEQGMPKVVAARNFLAARANWVAEKVGIAGRFDMVNAEERRHAWALEQAKRIDGENPLQANEEGIAADEKAVAEARELEKSAEENDKPGLHKVQKEMIERRKEKAEAQKKAAEGAKAEKIAQAKPQEMEVIRVVNRRTNQTEQINRIEKVAKKVITALVLTGLVAATGWMGLSTVLFTTVALVAIGGAEVAYKAWDLRHGIPAGTPQLKPVPEEERAPLRGAGSN